MTSLTEKGAQPVAAPRSVSSLSSLFDCHGQWRIHLPWRDTLHVAALQLDAWVAEQVHLIFLGVTIRNAGEINDAIHDNADTYDALTSLHLFEEAAASGGLDANGVAICILWCHDDAKDILIVVLIDFSVNDVASELCFVHSECDAK